MGLVQSFFGYQVNVSKASHCSLCLQKLDMGGGDDDDDEIEEEEDEDNVVDSANKGSL